MILDAAPDNRLTLIFPTDLSYQEQDSFVRSGQRKVIPGARATYRFTVTPPVGSGVLIVLVLDSKIDADDVASRFGRGMPIAEARIAEGIVTDFLCRSRVNGSTRARWSMTTSPYRIDW